MYLPLQKEGIPDMIEAVPPKFAREIFKRLPRASSLPPSSPIPKVYIQLDPRFSFNEELAVKKVLYLVHLCVDKHNVPLENLVIKIPGSWEGIQAAKRLEEGGGEGGREGGVRCLVTAVTSIVQARAAAEAGVSYVAPYVGRVSDWKGEEGGMEEEEEREEGGMERGVGLARDMQILFRMRGWGKTKVMAASLRGQEQIKALTGCDILTISPKVMIELECADPVEKEEEGEEGREGGGGLRSFVPEVPTWEDLTPRSRRLLGGEGGREGGAKMTEGEFREALQRDACGTAVFAKSMKLFVEVMFLEKGGVSEGGGREGEEGGALSYAFLWSFLIDQLTRGCGRGKDTGITNMLISLLFCPSYTHDRTCAAWKRCSSTTWMTGCGDRSKVKYDRLLLGVCKDAGKIFKIGSENK
jgi:hypothetical protein